MKQGLVGLLPESAEDLAKLANPKLHCWLCQKRFETENVLTPEGWRETQISGLCELCFDAQFEDEEPKGAGSVEAPCVNVRPGALP